MKCLIAYFGAGCQVRELSADDVAAYTATRRAGGIVVDEDYTTGAVRPRSVDVDLTLLNRILNWAVSVRVNGVRLLDTNPLRGVQRVREHKSRRPLATWDRFLVTRKALRELADEAIDDAEHLRFVKIEFALVLAEATGRRLGSIRQLEWSDIDLEGGVIRWRAEADKQDAECQVPIPAALGEEIRAFRKELATVGGLCFPSEQDITVAMSRYQFAKWLRRAEKKARLPKLAGGLWHPYRRKWATERKHLAIADVAAAGGWRDKATLLNYTQPTDDAMLAVMSEPTKLRDVALAGQTKPRNGSPNGSRPEM